ncbi:hypothetical protein CI105_02665 [Candidatus Izimaplasma bacterium ZiA1]|uniref:M20 metallopeptidase family protein n=1 Tax=Candidatus Izimoplasma sp. ZiA1 TaxID=2024899 RepID=UPI000BAA404D|nr:hypothetical protein CI105_02665 [Candidatus Izimaplasma bacterium ZiA1]
MITRDQIKHLEDYVIKIRRHFHMHPEPGFQEFKTIKKVQKELESFGITDIKYACKTGIVARIKGKDNGNIIGLRADIDALMLTEENNVPYCSVNEGVMHACGHDAHTAMLLASAKYLQDNRNEINGEVVLIFQPAEEGPFPGGATKIIESGLIDDLDVIFGLHITTGEDLNIVNTKVGSFMAAPDEFTITITGEGTHASAPSTGKDPIIPLCEIVLAIQNLIPKEIPATTPAVIQTTLITTGSAHNIIPETATFGGTVRTIDQNTRIYLKTRIEEITKHISLAHRVTYNFNYEFGYDPLINNKEITEYTIKQAKDILGRENVKLLDNPIMGGEDFSFYLNNVKGSFSFIGARNIEKGLIHYNHSPKFDIDEDALLTGVLLTINNVLNYK